MAQVAPASVGSNDAYQALLGGHTEFKVAQTMKGCIQEMFGCEANSEFYFIAGGQQIGTIEEQSSCCIRFFCKGSRPWETKMVAGTDITAPGVLWFHRAGPFPCGTAMPMGNCKCCCYQHVEVRNGDNQTSIGSVTEKMWFCVPTFKTTMASGKDEYEFHQPTCCGGMVVNCCAQGCCNCRIPFLVYPVNHQSEEDVLKSNGSTPVPGIEGVPDAQICKVWSGLGTELFSDADTFELKAPDGADPGAKARLIGATLLVNQVFFEAQKGEQN